jgi:hypothetical protein
VATTKQSVLGVRRLQRREPVDPFRWYFHGRHDRTSEVIEYAPRSGAVSIVVFGLCSTMMAPPRVSSIFGMSSALVSGDFRVEGDLAEEVIEDWDLHQVCG